MAPQQPTRIEEAAHARRAMARRASAHQTLVDGAVTLEDAAAYTGASTRHLLRLVRRGRAAGLVVEGELRLPQWQLRRNAIAPLAPHTREIVDAFPGDLASLEVWMHRPHVDLGGETPAASVQGGYADRVARIVRALGAAGR